MNRPKPAMALTFLGAALLLLSMSSAKLNCQAQQQPKVAQFVQESLQTGQTNYPHYLQSPIVDSQATLAPPVQLESIGQEHRSSVQSSKPVKRPTARKISIVQEPGRPLLAGLQPGLQVDDGSLQSADSASVPFEPASCLYDKHYFDKLDSCLARKPYPIVGLLAFKNEDLLSKRGLSDRHGCLMVLNNGLFKNYQIHRLAVDSDSRCLDNSKVSLAMDFSNITLSYLWSLRCLNQADQLLDDATLDGRTSNPADGSGKRADGAPSLCVGSSQNLGFASLQLGGLESQVELATDIYRNWRVTNVTLSMVSSISRKAGQPQSEGRAELNESDLQLESSIKDYVFESLDGDELNWRYLHLYQNWARNRMHSNFVDQFRRFLWISLQRCLSESSEKLPIKLVDVFTDRKYT